MNFHLVTHVGMYCNRRLRVVRLTECGNALSRSRLDGEAEYRTFNPASKSPYLYDGDVRLPACTKTATILPLTLCLHDSPGPLPAASRSFTVLF